MGRKPLADVAKSDRPLRIRLTDVERQRLDDAAGILDKPTASWARDILMREAGLLIEANRLQRKRAKKAAKKAKRKKR